MRKPSRKLQHPFFPKKPNGKRTMDMNRCKELSLGLNALAIFRGILKDPVVEALKELLEAEGEQKVAAYGAFAGALYARGTVSLTDYLLTLVLEDENVYMLARAEDKAIDPVLEEAVRAELKIIESAGELDCGSVQAEMGYTGFLPRWKTEDKDFAGVYFDRLQNIHEFGYGVFAKYTTFMIQDGALVPVKHPDAISLSELGGYQKERQQVIDNTLALIEGRPAANALLYGDAGTGKSSTVKAVANAYASRGLRLIEIKKSQLHEIPHLVDQLSKNPLKFILFIDDLSFNKDDDNFAALKAILEGSVSARAANLAVYATSNRRHLVKEDFSDRQGTELHVSDTIQELTSLSDRFGLTITFQKPGKQVYLEIVHDLALQNGLTIPAEELDKLAEAFAIGRGGRSPRAAKQFVDSLCARQTME